MKSIIKFTVYLGEGNELENVVIDHNDSNLPSDKTLLVGLANAILDDKMINSNLKKAKKLVKGATK